MIRGVGKTWETPLKTVKSVGWHQELLQGRQMRRHDVRQALTSEFGVSSPSRGGRCKGVSLPFVLFAKLGRRRQFSGATKRPDQTSVVPINSFTVQPPSFCPWAGWSRV